MSASLDRKLDRIGGRAAELNTLLGGGAGEAFAKASKDRQSDAVAALLAAGSEAG